MAALGLGRPLLSVWHPAVGYSSHSKDCWRSAGTRGETPTTNFYPPRQGPYRLLSCPCSLYSTGLYHLPLERSVRVTPARTSKCPALAPWSIPAPLAFALQTPIPLSSSVSYWVLKFMNIYEPGFFQKHKLCRMQFPLGSFPPLTVTAQPVNPYLMFLRARSAGASAAVSPALSHEPLLLWVIG